MEAPATKEMVMFPSDLEKQIRATTAVLCDVLGGGLVSVCLHGSAATGKLRPQSDIDLMAVVTREVSETQLDDLLSAFLALSARHPNGPNEPRCLEVISFRKVGLGEVKTNARAEFLYGEWLRKAFERGERMGPVLKPDNSLIIEQARQRSASLYGPIAFDLFPETHPDQIRNAIQDAIPELLDGLVGDERNVLLTLARMWYTTRTGSFVSKDEAAVWAIKQLLSDDAAMLDLARRGYLGEAVDDWAGLSAAVHGLAATLAARVTHSF